MKHLFLILLTVLLGASVNAQNNSNSNLDSRIMNHYSAEQIAQLDEVTIAQLNFIFRSSYVLNNEKTCEECPTVDLNSFDVYNYKRELNNKKRVYLSNPGIPIDIMSIQELDIELERIKNEVLSSSH